tara:strand:+ start:180 stop:467 length:288 start_codon:yes stop_codon:yes gene_type:complete
MSKSPSKRKENFEFSDNLGIIMEEQEFNTLSPKDEIEVSKAQEGGLGIVDFACFDPKKESQIINFYGEHKNKSYDDLRHIDSRKFSAKYTTQDTR